MKQIKAGSFSALKTDDPDMKFVRSTRRFVNKVKFENPYI